MRALLPPALLLCAACADPSEVRSLQARKEELAWRTSHLTRVAENAKEAREALEQVPLAGMPLEPAEITRRVSQATPGVAVTVERDGSGLHVALQGPAAPLRAALTLRELSAHLPDLQLEQVELEPGRFLAHGRVASWAPATAPPPKEERMIIPRSEVKKLREDIARMEQGLQELERFVGPELESRGLAALEALRSPARFRRQSRLLQAVAGFAASARVRYEGSRAEVAGVLLPDRKVMDVLPALKSDHELLMVSTGAGGQFDLKLGPRAN